MEPVSALRASRSARIRLSAAPSAVFPLFTPEGERRWVEGWNPESVYPADGAAELHSVFLTHNHAAQPSIWAIVGLDAEHFRVSYLRAAPDSHVAFIAVECAEDGPGRTVATVSYTFTGLSAAGNDYVAGFTPEHYGEWIGQWEVAINRYLDSLRHASKMA